MTFQQAATAAGVTEDDIIDAIAAGALLARLHRNRVLILSCELEAWLTDLPRWMPADQRADESTLLRLA